MLLFDGERWDRQGLRGTGGQWRERELLCPPARRARSNDVGPRVDRLGLGPKGLGQRSAIECDAEVARRVGCGDNPMRQFRSQRLHALRGYLLSSDIARAARELNGFGEGFGRLGEAPEFLIAVGKIQERYGIAKDEAERQVDTWLQNT